MSSKEGTYQTHAEELLEEEKKLKTEIKKEDAELQASTKSTIENLSNEQVNDLLEQKWITPLHTRLISLPDTVIDIFVSKLQALSQKYENTYFDIEKEIQQTGTALASMIDDLCGSEFDLKGLAAFKSLLIGE